MIRTIAFHTGEMFEIQRTNASAVKVMLNIVASNLHGWVKDSEKPDYIRSLKFESSDQRVSEFMRSEISRKYSKFQ